MFSLSIRQIFALPEVWFCSRLFLSRFPLVYKRSSFKCLVSKAKKFLPLFDCFIYKRKSDRYMNLSGKEVHFGFERSMLGAIKCS